MAQEIIILNQNIVKPGLRRIRFVFWIPVTVGDEYPLPEKTSAYKDALTAEITALQNGTVIEEVHENLFPATISQADAEAQVLALYTTRAASFTTTQGATLFPGYFYGRNYNGTTWVDPA